MTSSFSTRPLWISLERLAALNCQGGAPGSVEPQGSLVMKFLRCTYMVF